MSASNRARRIAALLTAAGLTLIATGTVAAHEARTVAGYDMEVGFIDEPVAVGQRSGLEFFVHKGDAPVEGLESTVKAEVIYRMARRASCRDQRKGGRSGSVRVGVHPDRAGPYTFHLTGTIEGNAIDESFTSKPGGFDEVQESAARQFPVQFPSQAQTRGRRAGRPRMPPPR